MMVEESVAQGQDVPEARSVSTWSGQAREQAVQRMFTAIAGVYDLNNTLLSFGLHYRWKKLTASFVPSDAGSSRDPAADSGTMAPLRAAPLPDLNAFIDALKKIREKMDR